MTLKIFLGLYKFCQVFRQLFGLLLIAVHASYAYIAKSTSSYALHSRHFSKGVDMERPSGSGDLSGRCALPSISLARLGRLLDEALHKSSPFCNPKTCKSKHASRYHSKGGTAETYRHVKVYLLCWKNDLDHKWVEGSMDASASHSSTIRSPRGSLRESMESLRNVFRRLYKFTTTVQAMSDGIADDDSPLVSPLSAQVTSLEPGDLFIVLYVGRGQVIRKRTPERPALHLYQSSPSRFLDLSAVMDNILGVSVCNFMLLLDTDYRPGSIPTGPQQPPLATHNGPIRDVEVIAPMEYLGGEKIRIGSFTRRLTQILERIATWKAAFTTTQLYAALANAAIERDENGVFCLREMPFHDMGRTPGSRVPLTSKDRRAPHIVPHGANRLYGDLFLRNNQLFAVHQVRILPSPTSSVARRSLDALILEANTSPRAQPPHLQNPKRLLLSTSGDLWRIVVPMDLSDTLPRDVFQIRGLYHNRQRLMGSRFVPMVSAAPVPQPGPVEENEQSQEASDADDSSATAMEMEVNKARGLHQVNGTNTAHGSAPITNGRIGTDNTSHNDAKADTARGDLLPTTDETDQKKGIRRGVKRKRECLAGG